MPQTTTKIAKENGTYIVNYAFTDDAGGPVIPNHAYWTLTDNDGNIINSREQVEISTMASSGQVVLSGDDLAIQTGETGDYVRREWTIEYDYDNTLGTDWPGKDVLQFPLENLRAKVTWK